MQAWFAARPPTCEIDVMQPRKPTAKRLSDLVSDAMGPALAQQGFAGREVVSRWNDIVGERLAVRSRPQRIEWPKRRADAGDAAEKATLVVLVESAFAPELQHAAPVVLARVNAHLGWPAVGRMVLRQGPVNQPKPSSRPTPPDIEAARQAADARNAVNDPDLKAAVTRLGAAVLSRHRNP
jgi:hypothetical protein